MKLNYKKVLIIGYGNPGRVDDGLGPAFIRELEKLKIPNLTLDSNYQLAVEDAYDVSKHDIVVFVDATVAGEQPYYLREIIVANDYMNFSTHSVKPENVMALAWNLFNAKTRGFVLGIKGYKFDEFGERLSQKAQKNLTAAIDFFKKWLQSINLSGEKAENANIKNNSNDSNGG